MTITLDTPMPKTGTGTVPYADLTPAQQAGWDQLEELTSDDHLTADHHKRLHQAAAAFLGLTLVNGELIKCDDCDAIGDEYYFGAYDNRPLCSDCVGNYPRD